jgi:hypothetical protein
VDFLLLQHHHPPLLSYYFLDHQDQFLQDFLVVEKPEEYFLFLS